MAKGILMPKTGITVEECILTEWVKKKGEIVKKGDILFTYETDKATFECESTEEGILLETFYEEGDEVPVLVNVCAIGQEGESVEELHQQKEECETVNAVNENEQKRKGQYFDSESGSLKDESSRLKISPRARRTAENLEVNPALVTATGANGRVIARDIQAYILESHGAGFDGTASEMMSNSTNMPEEENHIKTPEDYVDFKFSAIRRATAKAMMTSLSTMAQLTHVHSFDATAILNQRKQIKAQGDKIGLPNITLNDMILYAVSRVLLKHDNLNAIIPEENVLRKYNNVHLGMAVHTERGLFVPTIFEANKKSLAEIAMESKKLAQICKEGKATPQMLEGASFTVSNVGSLGVEMFTPVVNPPQVGILGVCGITTRIREKDGEIQTYPAMGLALSYDHRALDGTPASMFVKDLCIALENFNLLMMQ